MEVSSLVKWSFDSIEETKRMEILLDNREKLEEKLNEFLKSIADEIGEQNLITLMEFSIKHLCPDFNKQVFFFQPGLVVKNFDQSMHTHTSYAYWTKNGDIVIETSSEDHSIPSEDTTFIRFNFRDEGIISTGSYELIIEKSETIFSSKIKITSIRVGNNEKTVS